MIRISLRVFVLRELRAILTGIAVMLGVAMVYGTYVLTDEIYSAFHSISADFTQERLGRDHGQEADQQVDADPDYLAGALGTGGHLGRSEECHRVRSRSSTPPILGRNGKAVGTGGRAGPRHGVQSL